MIVYSVKCESGHEFEGWFRSSSSFDSEVAAGEVACPKCGSIRIKKAPMAPAVAGTKGSKSAPAGCPAMEAGGAPPPCAGSCGCFPG